MTTTINYKNSSYACEFIADVKVEGEEMNGQFRIYVTRHGMRAFLVTEFCEVIAQCIIFFSYQLDALLDDEDKNHVAEVKKLCNNFAESIYNETWDEVTITLK